MIVLVANIGSTSFKFRVFDMTGERELARGGVERIGKDGAAIRKLGEEAREEIEAFLGRPVFLSLRVRVLPTWRRNSESLRRLGYRK